MTSQLEMPQHLHWHFSQLTTGRLVCVSPGGWVGMNVTYKPHPLLALGSPQNFTVSDQKTENYSTLGSSESGPNYENQLTKRRYEYQHASGAAYDDSTESYDTSSCEQNLPTSYFAFVFRMVSKLNRRAAFLDHRWENRY